MSECLLVCPARPCLGHCRTNSRHRTAGFRKARGSQTARGDRHIMLVLGSSPPTQHPTDTPLKTPPSVPSLTIAVGLASLLEARRDGSNLSLNTGCQNPRGAHCRGHQRMSQPPGDGSTASPPQGLCRTRSFPRSLMHGSNTWARGLKNHVF